MVNIIDDPTIKWCSVALSDVIDRGKRLEASVFDVEAKQAFNIIKNSKYPKVNLISPDGFVEKAHYGGRLKRNYIKPNSINSIGFIGSSEMLDIYPNPVKFMLNDKKVEDLKVKENTVLISRSGTIGNVTLVNKTLSELLVSEHAIRLECFDYAGYVYTYLKTEIGKKLVCSNIYGAVIQQIEPEHLASVPIPNPPEEIKKKIHDLIIRSYELRDESNVLLDKAEQMLIEELKLPPIEKMQDLEDAVETFNVKLSELNQRADVSYHVPVVKAILKHLKEAAGELTTIGDERISKGVVLPGRFKRVYVENGYGVRFLGGKELKQLNPTTEKYLSKVAHKKQLEGSLGIKEYSILTPARGSLGDVILPCKHFINWAISDNVMQILSNKEMCGYTYIFLNTAHGKELIKRFTYGGVIDAIEPFHIQQVIVPLLKDKDKQAEINALALEANEKRYQAYCLEQEALKIMDEEVIYCK